MRLTKPQQISLKRKWSQDSQGLTYRQFRRTAVQAIDCILVPWCGMWLGLELDGYCHS